MKYVICQAMTFSSQVKSNCKYINSTELTGGIVCQKNSLESQKYIRVAVLFKGIQCNFKESYSLLTI